MINDHDELLLADIRFELLAARVGVATRRRRLEELERAIHAVDGDLKPKERTSTPRTMPLAPRNPGAGRSIVAAAAAVAKREAARQLEASLIAHRQRLLRERELAESDLHIAVRHEETINDCYRAAQGLPPARGAEIRLVSDR